MRRTWRRVGRAIAVAGLAPLIVVGNALAAADTGTPDYPRLFGTREFRSTKLEPFPKWTGMLERYFAGVAPPEGSCEERRFNRCHLEKWEALPGRLRGESREVQLLEVHRYLNEAPYITDPINYRVPDYWATVRQFLARDGDCEDYAIAKFLSLRALGWDNELLRVAVVQDLNLGIAHAVLVAYHRDTAWVLDNQIEQVVAANRIYHYRPYFSINEEGWWLHRADVRARRLGAPGAIMPSAGGAAPGVLTARYPKS